jgi:NAD(P)-dependent dehydrogenase (short-subunit alcohol dehydrogenase family)
MNRLENKVCIVTGGGAASAEALGNGSAAALAFAREGATVVINDLDQGAAEVTLGLVEAEGGRASICLGDLTREADARALVDHAVGTWGRLDVLHNNIGSHGDGSVVDATREYWDRVFAITVTTGMLASKFAIPAMIEAGGGSIVNIASIAALRPHGMTPYTAAKGAVMSLTTGMAFDHAKDGIRVNCIAPGPVFTLHVKNGEMDPALREKRRLASPLGREGTPWDVANAAVYLHSDEARWVTGVMLPVDGGVLLTSADR